MPGCAFLSCKNHSRQKNKADGITYHAFPSDAIWSDKWAEVVRKQRKEPYWMPNEYHRICSLHFRAEDVYKTNKGLKRISKNAVPYFHAEVIIPKSSSSLEKPTLQMLENPMSPSFLDNESVSESIIDSPRICYLQRKLRKETLKKKIIMQENQNLKKRNKILKERCKNLSVIVKILKKKILEDQKILNQFTKDAGEVEEAADLFQASK